MEKEPWIKTYFEAFELCRFFLNKPFWGHRSKPPNLKTTKSTDSNRKVLKQAQKNTLNNAINFFILVNTSKTTLLFKS